MLQPNALKVTMLFPVFANDGSPFSVETWSWWFDSILAIGAYQPDTREVDDETMRRGVVVIESHRSALAEAGEIVQSIAAGVLVDSELITLSELVLQRPDLPSDAVRVFKGTGMPWQDLAVAGMFAERAGVLMGTAGRDETRR